KKLWKNTRSLDLTLGVSAEYDVVFPDFPVVKVRISPGPFFGKWQSPVLAQRQEGGQLNTS
ncbi:MAG: hypothetical protein IJ960_01780, partial [Oscillospiraceae bacterium]|nr:hypothetical protein [Oscillospiraceae bacterium]